MVIGDRIRIASDLYDDTVVTHVITMGLFQNTAVRREFGGACFWGEREEIEAIFELFLSE